MRNPRMQQTEYRRREVVPVLLVAVMFCLMLAGCATRQVSPVYVERWGGTNDGKAVIAQGK